MPQPPHSLDYIRQVLAEYFADKPVQRVEIFGSCARGEATAESDLDVLLSRVPDARLTLFDLGHYQEDLEEALGIPIDLGTQIDPYVWRYVRQDITLAYEKTAA